MPSDHRGRTNSIVPGPSGRRLGRCRTGRRLPGTVGALTLAASFLFAAALSAEEPRTETPKKAYGANCFEGDCHSAVKGRKVLHGPIAVMACGTCHKPAEGEEHHFELAREEEDLCTFCHVLPEPGKFVHKPYEQKGCLYCHDPHGGDSRPFLVKGEGPGGPCAQCHEPSKEKRAHRPYADGNCSACHASHQSSEDALLRKPEKMVCLSCHESLAEELASAGKVHEPVEKGKCGSCHKAHASEQPGLLSAAYPNEFYEEYNPKKYELCFGCHAAEIFSSPEDGKGGFLDGSRNLHFVHVNSRKGHTCRVCHPAHASPGPELKKLIRNEVPFGDWKLPIGFQETPQGGKCASGCHKEAAYVRGSVPIEPPAEGKTQIEGETPKVESK